MSKVYLILGASSDIGIELLRTLNNTEQKAFIWAHYCSSDENINKIQVQHGNEIETCQCDFSEIENSRNLAQKIIASGKIPNTVIHLPAPKFEYQKFKNLDWEECINDINIQVASLFTILQLLLPQMIKQEVRAKVVVMLSENTILMPSKFSTKYTMSKYMMLGLMRALTAEYDGKNVNINAISPAMVDTKLLSRIERRMLEVAGVTENMLKPQSVIPPIMKLISGDSDDMFGKNVHVAGDVRNE